MAIDFMRRWTARGLVALTLGVAVALAGSGVPSTEASLVHASVYCITPPGAGAEVTFHWQAAPGASMQFLDISLVDNGFQPGSYAAIGPLSGGDQSFKVPGAIKGQLHYWRVTALTPDGWIASETGIFMPCGYTDLPTTQCNDMGPPFLSTNTQTPEAGEGVTFLFDEGVGQVDRYFYVRGISEVRRFLMQNVGRVVDQPFCVDVRKGYNDAFGPYTLALVVGHRILSYSGSPAWMTATEVEKVGTVIHEYVHVLQGELAGAVTWIPEPVWITEGVATMIEFRALAGANIFSLDQGQSKMGIIGRYEQVRDLPELTIFSTWEELCSARGFCYSLAWMAVEHMLNGQPLSSLRTYYELQGRGVDWWIAFERAFGWNVLDFFDSFQKHREDVHGDR